MPKLETIYYMFNTLTHVCRLNIRNGNFIENEERTHIGPKNENTEIIIKTSIRIHKNSTNLVH